MRHQLIFAALLLLIFCGCRTPAPLGKTSVAWRTHLAFQPVGDLIDAPKVSVHQVNLGRKGTSFPLLGQIEIEGERFVCAGISPSGVRVFLLEFDHNGMVYEQHALLPRLMKGKYLLGDLQCIYWPVESLRTGGLEVRTPDANTRIISHRSRDLIKIWYKKPETPWNTSIHYENLQRKYEIKIEPIKQ